MQEFTFFASPVLTLYVESVISGQPYNDAHYYKYLPFYKYYSTNNHKPCHSRSKPTRHSYLHHPHPWHTLQFNTLYQYYHIFLCHIIYYLHSSYSLCLIVSLNTAILASHVIITTTTTHTLQLLQYVTKSTSDNSIIIHYSYLY